MSGEIALANLKLRQLAVRTHPVEDSPRKARPGAVSERGIAAPAARTAKLTCPPHRSQRAARPDAHRNQACDRILSRPLVQPRACRNPRTQQEQRDIPPQRECPPRGLIVDDRGRTRHRLILPRELRVALGQLCCSTSIPSTAPHPSQSKSPRN